MKIFQGEWWGEHWGGFGLEFGVFRSKVCVKSEKKNQHEKETIKIKCEK